MGDIINFKSGYKGNISEKIPTLEEVNQKEINQDYQKFKTFCKNLR